MCDRKNIPEDIMDRMIEHAIEGMKKEQEESLGKTLVRANQLGLRVIKGGRKLTSRELAEIIKRRIPL